MAIQRVSVVSTELSCEVRGQGKTLVFVHGNAGTRQNWRPQIEYFARRFRVVAPDLRGHGDSEKPTGPYPISAFVGDLARLLDALDIDRAVIAGHSMGGYGTIRLAMKYPPLTEA